jgi:hypothetical protein
MMPSDDRRGHGEHNDAVPPLWALSARLFGSLLGWRRCTQIELPVVVIVPRRHR